MIKIVKELLDSKAFTAEVGAQLDAAWKDHAKVLNDENKLIREDNEKLMSDIEKAQKASQDEHQKLEEKIAKAKKDGESEVVKKLQLEQDEKEQLRKTLDKVQQKNKSLKLDKLVADELKKFDIRDDHKSDTEFRLRSRVTVDDDGKNVYTEGGETMSVEDGFKKHFETNQTKLNSKGDGGSGSQKPGSGGQKTDTKDLTANQKMALGRKSKSA